MRTIEYPAMEDSLHQIVDTIIREIDPVRVILFGSHGRGEAHLSSDIDLMIVLKKRRKRYDKFTLSNAVYRALATFAVPVDIIISSETEMEFWKDSLNDIHARALREGKLLYERPEKSAAIA